MRVLYTVDGRCYVFGRNDRGQLGLADTESRHMPVRLSDCEESSRVLEGQKIVNAAVSAFVTSE